jgi:hypothetical protein
MHTCAFCKREVDWKSAWRGREQRLYCNEFCAEDEDFTFPLMQTGQNAGGGQPHGREF